ncbi:hypothetical protein QQ008_07300 [Fulvivirgaceae bacterium BMA10]|uniref:Ribosomal protein S3 n=1 Tax=Splendidivirga corallicola TaxID=3051826 RepID=A0ABT8KKC4_9BACT|nr:hypothetical protein [Fulvivirgaceae bacterium BMA10]
MNSDNLHNRRRITLPKPKQGKGIKGKLKEYMESVTIDVFGYEKIVDKSVQNFALETANIHGISPNKIFVRIIKPSEVLRVFLHAGGRQIKELTILELVHFFVGNSNPKTGSKVAESVSRFLEGYANQKLIKVSQLQILISSSPKGSLVKSFNEQSFMEYIPVKFLIKYFKS